MISNTIAYLISRKYQDVALFDLLAKQDGLELPSMEEQREQIVLRVEDAMRKPDLPPLQASDTLARALEIAETSTEEVLLVRFPTGRWAGIARKDLPAMASAHPRRRSCAKFCPRRACPSCIPISGWMTRLRFIQGHALLPVVSRAGSRKLEGVHFASGHPDRVPKGFLRFVSN